MNLRPVITEKSLVSIKERSSVALREYLHLKVQFKMHLKSFQEEFLKSLSPPSFSNTNFRKRGTTWRLNSQGQKKSCVFSININKKRFNHVDR